MKKILIFYTSVGLGHKSLAENIAYYLEEAGFEVKLADIGKVQKGKFEYWVTGIHQLINKRLPFVWGWLYRFGHYVVLPFRVFIAGFNYKSAKVFVDEFQPDLIISTQTTASAVIAYLKKQGLYKNKFAIAFSDFHLHPYWLYKQADFYLANIEQQKTEMLALGIPPEKIFICGITLKPKSLINIEQTKKQLGIDSNQNVVLVGTGSLGLGFKNQDLQELSRLENTKIIFVCGKNKQLFVQIKKLNYPNVIALGFYEPMDELYAIGNIFVGKPGGLSTGEALSWNLPLLVTFTLPGQEEKNLDYLVNRKLVMPRPQNLALAITEELHSHNFRNQLQNNLEANKIIAQSQSLINALKQVLA